MMPTDRRKRIAKAVASGTTSADARSRHLFLFPPLSRTHVNHSIPALMFSGVFSVVPSN